MIACPKCSRANPATASFCHHDGTPLEAVEPAVAPRPVPPAPTWQPLERRARPALKAPAAAIPLTPIGRQSSRAWLVLLPAALLVLVGAGVGVALSLPPHPPVTETSTAPPPEERQAETTARPSEEPAAKVPRRSDVPDRSRLVERVTEPPVMTVPEFAVPEVEVVFCLDTTGSMGGLLRGAQGKIWSICNRIAAGRPTPALKVGLVAYRDKGDDYVTKVTDLTRDLDAVHQELLSLKAAGGGDIPESVNQALDDAVNRVGWSKDRKTLRIIFLVGDAPPHMDYKEVKYPQTCKKAVEKGIVINAIQCGDDRECRRHWKEIASKAGGEYVAIPQTGGVRVVATPFDDRLTELLGELMDTALIHGDDASKNAGRRMVGSAKRLSGPAAADRVAFAARTKRLGPNDLLDDVDSRRVTLGKVEEEHLPDALKKLDTLEQRKAQVEKVRERRSKLYEEALDLEKKRAEHVKEAMAGGGKDGFDEQVLNALRKQAKKFDVAY